MGDEMNPVAEAERDGRLLSWAKEMSSDAQTIVRMLPFGGHVRLRPSVSEALAAAPPPASPFAWTPSKSFGQDDDDIEGFTVEAKHLQSFFRAGGATRTESRERVMAALTELTLRDLVKVYQDEAEEPRYALTENGLKVQNVLSAAAGV